MFYVLSLGFLIGLRHALEADHVAAVASLTPSYDINQRGDEVRGRLGTGPYGNPVFIWVGGPGNGPYGS